jgi:hypothetical protein
MNAADVMAMAKRSADSDLAFLLKAKEEAKLRMKADPSPENINAFNKAKASLDAEMAKNQQATVSGEVLGSILKVENYLTSAGWKIKKSKLYQDKKKGLLKMQPDGTVTKADADAYAAAYLAPADAAPDADDAETLRIKRETFQVELENKRLAQERMKRKMAQDMGELLPRAEVDEILVAAVTVLKSTMRQFFYVKGGEIVELVDGNPAKIEGLIHFLLNESNHFFNGFAKARSFDVVDDGDDEEGDAATNGDAAA